MQSDKINSTETLVDLEQAKRYLNVLKTFVKWNYGSECITIVDQLIELFEEDAVEAFAEQFKNDKLKKFI